MVPAPDAVSGGWLDGGLCGWARKAVIIATFSSCRRSFPTCGYDLEHYTSTRHPFALFCTFVLLSVSCSAPLVEHPNFVHKVISLRRRLWLREVKER